MRVEIDALHSQSRLIGAQQAFELHVFVISMWNPGLQVRGNLELWGQ
jgi:hypothetical protein